MYTPCFVAEAKLQVTAGSATFLDIRSVSETVAFTDYDQKPEHVAKGQTCRRVP